MGCPQAQNCSREAPALHLIRTQHQGPGERIRLLATRCRYITRSTSERFAGTLSGPLRARSIRDLVTSAVCTAETDMRSAFGI